MRESETVAALRRELGRQLAARRKAAGYLQRELGTRMGYSRTAIANAETGSTKLGRQFWQRADRVLATGELFTRGYERVRAQTGAESRAAAGQVQAAAGAAEEAASGRLQSLTAGEARQALAERGWPVTEGRGGRLWLVTGRVVDALEVPRQAGMVAIGWWLYTRGLPDEIRGLPALPDPVGALAAITAGPRCYFLTQSGMCPWTRRDFAAVSAPAQADPVVVRWHAGGGRVPAPPSPLAGSGQATWAHVPAGAGPLVSPMAILHVLAHAVAATREGVGVSLPGGVRAVPAPLGRR